LRRRDAQEHLKDYSTQAVDITLVGDLILLLVEVLMQEILDLVLALIDFAIALVDDLAQFVSNLNLLRRYVHLVPRPGVK